MFIILKTEVSNGLKVSNGVVYKKDFFYIWSAYNTCLGSLAGSPQQLNFCLKNLKI